MSATNARGQDEYAMIGEAFAAGKMERAEALAAMRRLGFDEIYAAAHLDAIAYEEAEPTEHCPNCEAVVDGDGLSIDERCCFYCRAD